MKYNLDTSKRDRQFTITGLHVGDNGFRSFEFNLSSGGEPFPLPESCLATIYATLPGGVVIYDSCEIRKNTIVYKLKGSDTDGTGLTSLSGYVECEIRIIGSEGEIITSPKFTMIVDPVFQDDEAVEAQSSFSALTEALGRVLEAESGLDSKVDKVIGVEGNAVVFGPSGAIADSGTAPAAVYTLFYDEEGTGEFNGKNLETLSQIATARENGTPYMICVDYAGSLYPAVDLGGWVRASFENGGGYVEIRKVGSRLTYKQIDNYASSFSETGVIPATQKAIAEWVKSYVNEKLLIDTEVVL